MGRVIAMRGKRKPAKPAKMATVSPIGWRPFHISHMADDKLRFARTQQEAGIGHLEWEDRAPPLRGWCKDLVAGALIFLFAAACIFIATAGQP
jgi:hypothetical protein